MSPNTGDLQSSGAASKAMSEAPRLQNSENEPLPPSQYNELNEIAWQKWIERNKDRDAAYRKKVDPDTLAHVLVACRCGLCLAAHGEQVVSKACKRRSQEMGKSNCEEKSRLLEPYQNATRAYADAVESLRWQMG